MINDPYTALRYILQSNTEIASLLATYKGTNIPLIAGGGLPETQTDLPAIVYYNNTIDLNHKIEDSTFTINCYAKTDRESLLLARTVVKELDRKQDFSNGYPVSMTCKILATIPNPNDNEVNTAVEMRLYNINGGA